MKKFYFLLPIFALMCACSSNDDVTKPEEPEICIWPIAVDETRAQEIRSKTNDMAWTLLRQSISEENTILSPLSLVACMAMVDNGAVGETETQIREFLGYGDFSQEEFNSYLMSVLGVLPLIDQSVTFTAANSLWYDQTITPKGRFSYILNEFYHAETYKVDFINKKDEVKDEINAWCNEKTNGLIPKLIERFSSRAPISMLINAIYFKAAWSLGFGKDYTWKDPFYKGDGTCIDVNFMNRISYESGFKGEAINMACLSMGDEEMYQTFFVMPKDGTTLDEAAAEAQKALAGFATMDDWKRYETQLHVPKFTVKSNKSLRETLIEMGLGKIFSGDADYSNMFNELGKNDILLSDIRQACFFMMDEDKVEGAAVTGAEMECTGMPDPETYLYINLDRPFLYGVFEKTTGTILFLGAMQEPVE